MHPLVTSTTPDVSLKHTGCTGGDDDQGVLEKDHDDDDVLNGENRNMMMIIIQMVQNHINRVVIIETKTVFVDNICKSTVF